MKILITGAKGFIGAELSIFLKNKFSLFRVDCITDNDIIYWDLVNDTTPPKIIVNNHFDFVIHLASVAHSKIDNEFIFKINTKMTRNLLKALSNKFDHFIFFSSTSVFHEINQNYPISVYSKCNPYTYYGKSKLHDELVIRKLNFFSIIRLCPTISGKTNRDLLKRIVIPGTNIPFKTKEKREYNFATLDCIKKQLLVIIENHKFSRSLSILHDNVKYNQLMLLEISKINRPIITISSKIFNFLIRMLSVFNRINYIFKLNNYIFKLFNSVTFSNEKIDLND